MSQTTLTREEPGLADRARRIVPHWPWLAALISALMLAAAHAFEAAGYEPCALCYTQRHVYWAAIAVGGIGALAAHFSKNPLLGRAATTLLGVTFLAGASIAIYHAGAEWKFWPGPSTCATTGAGSEVTAESIAAALGAKTKVVPCDEAAWRDPVIGLSMAGWNALASLGLAGVSLAAAFAPDLGQGVRKAKA
jgi:disulfide bond formation protein DsbB